MIERQSINGKEVWLKVDPFHMDRANPNVIPTEYFTATYFLDEPSEKDGEVILDEDGSPRLFESPVAALSYTLNRLKKMI